MTDVAGLRHVGGLEQTERLGVEEEFHVVDLTTRELVARGPEVLARLSDQFTAELQKSVVESNSSVCNTLDELRTDLKRLRAEAVSVADVGGCRSRCRVARGRGGYRYSPRDRWP